MSVPNEFYVQVLDGEPYFVQVVGDASPTYTPTVQNTASTPEITFFDVLIPGLQGPAGPVGDTGPEGPSGSIVIGPDDDVPVDTPPDTVIFRRVT